MKKTKVYRDRIICLLFSLFLLMVLELASRTFFPHKDRMAEILSILKQDPQLFWRQKANLNVDFQSSKVKTNSFGLRGNEFKKTKDKDTFRIVCLGASPTFGWGVGQDQTYPYKLETLLGEKYPGRNIEVINAGNIGYSSYQGLMFFKDYILGLSPDLITISYVINDVDKHRFYRSDGRSDKELEPKNRFLVWTENILDNSNLYKLLKGAILNSQGLAAKYFSRGGSGVYLEKHRVSAKDYRENLNKFIEAAGNNNSDIVMVVMPVNLPSGETTAGALSSKDLYCKGVLAEKKGNFEDAKKYFQEAKEMELYQCSHLGKDYNNIMREVAGERNIAVVDIAATFENVQRVSGIYLFLDPSGDTIHPNAIGHKLISRQVYDVLIKYGFMEDR